MRVQDLVDLAAPDDPGGRARDRRSRAPAAPGGQNVNKVSSKVDLRWNVATSAALTDEDRAWLLQQLRSRLTSDGTLIVTSTLTRDQIKNRDDAEGKLALIVRAALERPKTRRPTKVSRGAKRRRVADKRHHAEIKKQRRARRRLTRPDDRAASHPRTVGLAPWTHVGNWTADATSSPVGRRARIRHARGVRSCLVALGLVVACGDNRLPGIDDFVDAYAEAFCAHVVRCGELPDAETCARVVRFTPLHPDLIAAVRAGKVRWHDEIAHACIELVASRSCDLTSEEGRRPCGDIITGTLGDGAACAYGGQCVSQECWLTACESACCMGTCVGTVPPQRGAIGDVCRFAPCAEGWCDRDVCVPFRIEGEACGSDAECAYGLACPWRERVCRPLPGPGERCLNQCRDLGQACSYFQQCEPVRRPGSLCYTDAECGLYLTCGPGSQCMDRRAAIGEPCDGGAVRCEDPEAYCRFGDSREGVCVPREPDGATCTADGQCASYVCDALGTCTSESCI